jgi:hypothetical protein
MGYHIRQNHTGKEKFEKFKRIKNSISGKIEDVNTLFYMHGGILSEGQGTL